MNRRIFLRLTGITGAGCLLGSGGVLSCAGQPERPNILLITADDLNYDSVGCYGCRIPGITPHIDRLAAEGMRFFNGHMNIAVCQPSRQSIMTGRYPHRNGAEGFEPIDENVPTLQEHLHEAGYLNGIMGKERHLKPGHKYCWDYCITEHDLASGAGIGRSPQRYYEYTKGFIDMAEKQGQPFFLMANSHDPHRPFAGSVQEKRSWGNDLPVFTRRIHEDEVSMPAFLPDLPDIRTEVAQYYTSVHRCDQTVGAVLTALRESGLEKNTLVMFISDNGMSFPFAKANCYLSSTKTPWIVRWPGKVKQGSADSGHFISGIDYMATILDAAGLARVGGMDGFSFLPLLFGKHQEGREYVFSEFHKTFAERRYPMRCVQNKRYGYILNLWAGKSGPMRMDSTGGLTFKAMQRAAAADTGIAGRVRMFEYRVPDEFYDFEKDPGALRNLISDPSYGKEIEHMRHLLKQHMQQTGDAALNDVGW